MGNYWDSSNAGDDTSIGLTCCHLSQGVGLSLPLAIIHMMRSIGVADNRGGGDNGSVSGAVTSIKEGQGSSIGLSCGHLSQSVGLCLPLAIIDTVVKSWNSSVGGRDDNGGAMGNHWETSDAGDNSSIGLSCGHLSQGVGLCLPLAIVDTVVKSGNSVG